MITTLKPTGAISEALVMNKYEDNGRYFIVDTLYNRIEITKKDYDILKCPIKKPKEARRI